MNLVFLGPPGAGKGTQARAICEALGIAHISTGEMFRRAIRGGTPMGVKAKEYLDAGELVPDSVTVEMVAERLREPDCQDGYLLDGFPRNMDQAKALSRISTLDAVVDITTGCELLVERMSGRRVCARCGGTYHASALFDPAVCPDCGGELIRREDDNPETIRSRLRIYREQTAPLTAYYARADLLVSIDGARPVEEVTANIMKAISSRS